MVFMFDWTRIIHALATEAPVGTAEIGFSLIVVDLVDLHATSCLTIDVVQAALRLVHHLLVSSGHCTNLLWTRRSSQECLVLG